MKDDIQKRAINMQPAIVFDEPKLSELVHEDVDATSICANDLRWCLLRYVSPLRRMYRRLPFVFVIAVTIVSTPILSHIVADLPCYKNPVSRRNKKLRSSRRRLTPIGLLMEGVGRGPSRL